MRPARRKARQMKACRIRDNSSVVEAELSKIPQLSARLANKTLGQLADEGVFLFPGQLEKSEDITREQSLLWRQSGNYRTGNMMGFLGCGEERLTITSRFSGRNDYFLQYLLRRVLDIPNIVNLEVDAIRNDMLFQFLVFLFPGYLKRAVKKGVFKEYVCRQYNDGNVRGSIDVARQLAVNVPFVGRVAYQQRDFSNDNMPMELVRHTIELIQRTRHGRELLATVRAEVKQVLDATSSYRLCDRQKVIRQNQRRRVRHPYFHEYIDLQELCLSILLHRRHQLGTGSKRLYGILFDGAWLWEEYLNTILTSAFYHPENKQKRNEEWLFCDERGGMRGKIYPDFIGKDSERRVIADAKYKPAGNIWDKDYLQLLAYMFRFDSQRGYYLYPDHCEMRERLFLNRGVANEERKSVKGREDIVLVKYAFSVPSEEFDSYQDFAAEMHLREQAFLAELPGTES